MHPPRPMMVWSTTTAPAHGLTVTACGLFSAHAPQHPHPTQCHVDHAPVQCVAGTHCEHPDYIALLCQLCAAPHLNESAVGAFTIAALVAPSPSLWVGCHDGQVSVVRMASREMCTSEGSACWDMDGVVSRNIPAPRRSLAPSVPCLL